MFYRVSVSLCIALFRTYYLKTPSPRKFSRRYAIVSCKVSCGSRGVKFNSSSAFVGIEIPEIFAPVRLLSAEPAKFVPVFENRINKIRAGHRQFFRHAKHRRGNARQVFPAARKIPRNVHIRRAEQIFFLMSSLFQRVDKSRRRIARINKIQTARRRVSEFCARENPERVSSNSNARRPFPKAKTDSKSRASRLCL